MIHAAKKSFLKSKAYLTGPLKWLPPVLRKASFFGSAVFGSAERMHRFCYIYPGRFLSSLDSLIL